MSGVAVLGNPAADEVRAALADRLAAALGAPPDKSSNGTGEGLPIPVHSAPMGGSMHGTGFAIVLFVVSVRTGSGSGNDVASGLIEALEGLAKAIKRLGDLENTNVCILLSGVEKIFRSVEKLEDKPTWIDPLNNYLFPDEGSTTSARKVLAAFVKALETAVRTSDPMAIRFLSFQGTLENDLAGSCDVVALVLSFVRQIVFVPAQPSPPGDSSARRNDALLETQQVAANKELRRRREGGLHMLWFAICLFLVYFTLLRLVQDS